MTTQENKALVRRLVDEGYNRANWSVFDELFAANFVNHDPSHPEVKDREGIKNWWKAICSAYPNHHITIAELIAEEGTVVNRSIFHGAQTLESGDTTATGKQVAVTSLSVYHIFRGQIKECWWNHDSLGEMQQLGKLP
jgi:predicted ester cyclase